MLRNTILGSFILSLFFFSAMGLISQETAAIPPDSVEPNGPGNLVPLAVGEEPQQFSLHNEKDFDWFVFPTEKGKNYQLIVIADDDAADMEIGIFGFGWTVTAYHGKSGEFIPMDNVAYDSYRPRISGNGYTGYYTIQILAAP